MLIFPSGSLVRVPEDSMYEFEFPKDLPVVYVTDNIGALNRLFSNDLDTYVNTVVVSNKLYKRSLFDGICYPLGKISEDEFTTYRLLYKSSKFVTTSQVLYGYVQRSASIMRSQFNAKRVDAFDAFEQALVLFEYNKLFELQLKCFFRYLETIIEFAQKVDRSASEYISDMLCMLDYRYELLVPRIDSFFKLHTEFSEFEPHFHELITDYRNFKQKVN